MANWYGTARSNYVRIKDKDMDGLKKALEPFPIQIADGYGNNEGKVCFLSNEPDSGGWPSVVYSYTDEDCQEEVETEFDPASQICPFMDDNQILVMMEAGAEKLRYITGSAQAYNNAGEFCQVTLFDIYEKAQEYFGGDVEITVAEY